MIELRPERVLAVISERRQAQSSTLIVYWLRVMGDRNQYQRALIALRSDTPIVPLIVRDGFDNANAIHSDLVNLIADNRTAFAELPVPFGVSNPLVLVLLARTDLGLSQVSSPATLPEWLPGIGGTTSEVIIDNLSTAAAAPMNAAEARVDDIARAIFDLEGALLKRLESVRESDHRLGNSFFSLLRTKASDETYAAFLSSARTTHESVQQPSGFRPSAGEGSSLVGRLMRVLSATSPDSMGALASAFSTALKLSDVRSDGAKDTILAVLLRPTVRDGNVETRLARNILVTVYASAQFSTAAAHADDYPGFLIVLLQGVSYNLRECLAETATLLASSPEPPPRVIPEQFRVRS